LLSAAAPLLTCSSSCCWFPRPTNTIKFCRFYTTFCHTTFIARSDWICFECEKAVFHTSVHRELVMQIRPPVQLIILSIGIRDPSRESTEGLISCLHSQHVGIWRIQSRLVIRVNILLVHKRNLQQVATQTGRGAYCISSPLRFVTSL
jgi:hypothetical protein